MVSPLRFEIIKEDPHSRARAGVIHTPHGSIETPAFVAVGTKGTVKSLTPESLRNYVGSQVVLANTYHLFLEPGSDIVKDAGGIHRFAHWDMPTMTDSGGFQVFSLGAAYGKGISKFGKEDVSPEEDCVPSDILPNVYSKEVAESHGRLCVIDEDGVTFTSHHDGSLHRFTPERSIEIQHAIGADIMFAFDECTAPHASYEYQKEALQRTHAWAKRSLLAHKYDIEALRRQALFGVVQGGRFPDLRKESAEALSRMDFDGFGIGGSFSKEDLGESLKIVTVTLPKEKPRHLLGIGEPRDITEGVLQGCDTFDCVQPTRMARHGSIYERKGEVLLKTNLKRSEYRADFSKPDASCDCYVCQNYTKAYLAHLFHAKEMLAAHLASIHNLYTVVKHTEGLRNNILAL